MRIGGSVGQCSCEVGDEEDRRTAGRRGEEAVPVHAQQYQPFEAGNNLGRLRYYKFRLPPEWLLKDCFIPLSPALEVFECLHLAVFIPSCGFDRLLEPKRAWKVRRLLNGSWERQGPPPIPIPAKTTRAAP